MGKPKLGKLNPQFLVENLTEPSIGTITHSDPALIKTANMTW